MVQYSNFHIIYVSVHFKIPYMDVQFQNIKTEHFLKITSSYNANGIIWDTCSILPDCKKKSICEKIIDIFDKCGLSQLQTAPTRMGTTLDLFRTNKPELMKNINNIPGTVDHDILLIDSNIQARSSKKPHRKVFKWSQGNW